MKDQDLIDWEENVVTYLNDLNNELIQNDDAKNLYYGFEVIDGQLKKNPEILFIGINPGSGSGERNYQIKFSSERISYLDYFDNEYNYPLARETVNIFREIGLSDEEIISKFENHCVKTNLYNIITHSDKEIKQCTNFSNGKFGDYYHNSISSCISLLKAIKPKIVIFEGKSIYDEVIGGCYEINNSWAKNLKFGHYFSEEENIHFIGYSRVLSTIVGKENIAAKLKSIGLN